MFDNIKMQENVIELYIKGLKIDAEIGVWQSEKGQTQSLIIDIDVICKYLKSDGDDYNKTVCYDNIAKKAIAFATSQHFYIVEWLASCLADLILEDKNILMVRVCVAKPEALPQADRVGVVITRLSNEGGAKQC